MDQPKMDLPYTPSDSQLNKDSHETNSKIVSPDCTSSESVDTGFVSDSTHKDSPSPVIEEKLFIDPSLPEKKEPAQLFNGNQSNGEKGEHKEIFTSSENTKPEPLGSLENMSKETLNLSESKKETETLYFLDSKDLDPSNSCEKKETDSYTSTGANLEDTNSLSDNKESEVHDVPNSPATDSDLPLEKEEKVTLDSETSETSNSPEMQTENEVEESVDILGNGLLKKKVLTAGAGRESRPTNGEVITLTVNGRLDDGTQVQDDEIIFTLNDGDVIVAFELAVALMEQGEKCELFTSARYAYGDLGREPDIPKDANITYTLELTDVKPPVNVATLSCDERLNLGEQKRERGNYLFKRSDYSGAINSYSKAVKVLDDADLNAGLDDESRARLADCWTKCYNNMAACQLKIDALDAAIRSCEKVLSHQSDNVKALFRLGKAYGAKGEIDPAIAYLKKAIKLDPESKMLHQEMLALTRKKNKETESERMLYQRMLGVKSNGQASKPVEENKNSNSVMKWTLALGAVTAAMVSLGLTWYRNS